MIFLCIVKFVNVLHPIKSLKSLNHVGYVGHVCTTTHRPVTNAAILDQYCILKTFGQSPLASHQCPVTMPCEHLLRNALWKAGVWDDCLYNCREDVIWSCDFSIFLISVYIMYILYILNICKPSKSSKIK